MKTMKASILAIGTELTSGQIVNKNAATLSAKLKAYGVQTTLHLTVPDDRPTILQTLAVCEQSSDLVFITGGLGPTSDDFTREVVAEWLGKPLQWDEKSWEHLSERLTSRGYTVKDIQRQQCYFPEGSRILWNREGTANGFHSTKSGTPSAQGSTEKNYFILPGPPKEIEACWQDGIHHWLDAKTQDLDRYRTTSWDTLGIGESDVAVIAEDVLREFKNENSPVSPMAMQSLEIGYRVHLPYVEFKISYFQQQETLIAPVLKKMDEALKTWTISKNGSDVCQSLFEKIQNLKNTDHPQEILFVAETSADFLLYRMQSLLKKLPTTHSWTFTNSMPHTLSQPLVFHIAAVNTDTVEIALLHNGQWRKDRLQSPYKTNNMLERRRQYFAEYALILWNRWLS